MEKPDDCAPRLVARAVEHCAGGWARLGLPLPQRGDAINTSSARSSPTFTTARCPAAVLRRDASVSRGCGGASRRPALRSLGFASVSMSGSGGNGEPDDLCDDAPVRDLDASLAIGKRRKGVVLTDPAEIEELKQELAKLTPEQREELRALAAQRVLNSFKDEDGTPLYDAFTETRKKLLEEEMGIGRPTIRDKPRWMQDLFISPYKLRRGAEKMELRRFEEDKLELELLGNGNVFSPAPIVRNMFGGRHDFSYALYANTKRMPELMAGEWADKDPNIVMRDPSFFHDLLVNGPGMELTLMVMPGRDLPVSEAVSAIRPAMLRTLESIEHDEGDTADVEVFLRMFNQRRMAGAPFLERDDKGNLMLKEDTRLMFKMGPDGQTYAEAITAGKIRDQQAIMIGSYFNPKVTYSFFDAFTGVNAVDPIGKQSIGRGALFITNGFTFQGGNPDQRLVRDTCAPPLEQLKFYKGEAIQETLEPSASLFTFSKPRPEVDGESTAGRVLLTGIRSYKQLRRAARRRARAASGDGAPAPA
eukprot:jgi/Tetstr1/426244/TSEL_016564.t1